MRKILSAEQKLSWLRLARSSRIGAITFSNLLDRFGSPEAALDALPEINARARGKPQYIMSREEAQKELDDAERAGMRHIAYCEEDYPPLLRHIDDKPPLVVVKGNTDIPSYSTIALVGARNASIAGQKMTSMLARDLGELGYIVVSGLARGIDTTAHKASLKTGTIAVIAGGHKKLYPPENQKLSEQIIEQDGTIISEMPPTYTARAQDFPRRNRIISGLSHAVVVVEAAQRSGSLITARLAAEQGRQVFAVPGSPLDPRADGANKLLRENGATLIRSASDIHDDIEPSLRDIFESGSDDQTLLGFEASSSELEWEHSQEKADIQTQILGQLSTTPVQIDDIIRFTNLPAGLILSALSDLEIAGLIERRELNTICLSELEITDT